MDERKILITPFPLLWYLSILLLDRLGKQRVTLIIFPGKLELLADVMGCGFLEVFQALSMDGPRMMATLLLT